MYKTANTELKDQVDVYSVSVLSALARAARCPELTQHLMCIQGENGQLKESNSRLERSLQQVTCPISLRVRYVVISTEIAFCGTAGLYWPRVLWY